MNKDKNIGGRKYLDKSRGYFTELIKPSYLKDQNSKTRTFFEILRIIFGAFATFLIVEFFVKDLFLSTGVTGIALIINSITHNISSINKYTVTIIFYGSIAVMNVVLFMYAFKRIERRTFLYSLIYVVCFTLLGFTLGNVIDLLPADDKLFSFVTNLNAAINSFISTHQGNEWTSSSTLFGMVGVYFAIAFVSGFLYGWALSVIYASRGTTGGSDFPIIYWSIKKGMDIGKVTLFANIIVVAIGCVISYIEDPLHKVEHYNFIQFITSYKIFGTLIFITFYSIGLNMFFPRSKKVTVQVVSKKAEEIAQYLFKEKAFSRSLTKMKAVGMYTKNETDVLICVMTYFECFRFAGFVKEVDSNAFINISPTIAIIGRFNIRKKFT